MHIGPLLLYELKQIFVRCFESSIKGAVVVGLASFVEFGLLCALGRKVPAKTELVLEVYFVAGGLATSAAFMTLTYPHHAPLFFSAVCCVARTITG